VTYTNSLALAGREASTLDDAYIGRALPVAAAVDKFLAAGRAGEIFEPFHFRAARPFVALGLHQHHVLRPDADDIEGG